MNVLATALIVAVMAPVAAYAAETTSVGDNTFLFAPGDVLRVFDVTTPHIPLEVAHIPISSLEFSYVPMDDGAYLAAVDEHNTLHILDVTIPYKPIMVSMLDGLNAQNIHDVDWARSDGQTFVLVSADDMVHVIDITDPSEPTPRNGDWRLNVPAGVHDTEPFWIGDGSYILVAGSDQINLIDIADSAHTTSTIQQGKYGFDVIGDLQDVDVVTIDGHVYALMLGAHSFMVADITHTSHPKHVDTIRYNTLLDMDILQTDDAVYALLMCVNKVHVIDMSTPTRPVFVSTIPTPTADVAGISTRSGNWALVVGESIMAADITDPASPVPGYVREGGPPFEPEAIETVIINGNLYALAASVGHNTIEITDITDPDRPESVSSVAGGQHAYGPIHGPHDIAIAETNGRTYAVVPNIYSNTVAILDIGNPDSPQLVSSVPITDMTALASATVVRIGTSMYAAVTGYYSDAIQLIDITDPRYPELGVQIRNGQYGFDSVSDPLAIESVIIGDSPYLLVASYYGNSVQIIDVSDPDAPIPAAAVFDGVNGYHLKSPHDIKAVHTRSGTFAVVPTTYDSGISIIDISNPLAPSETSHITDGRGFDGLDSVQHLDAFNHNGRSMVAASSYFDNTLQLIDITNPNRPRLLDSAVQGQDGFTSLVGPTSVSAINYEGSTYIAVADYFGNGIQFAEISDDTLQATSTVSSGLTASLPLVDTTGVGSITIYDQTYVLTATPSFGTVQITNVTNPLAPVGVSLLRDGVDGFVFDTPVGIETGTISTRHYAFVTGLASTSVQMIDISNPADPTPTSILLDDQGWVVETEFAHIGQTPYLVAISRSDDTLFMIDVSEPYSPVIVAAMNDVVSAVQSIDVLETHAGTWVFAVSFDGSLMHVIDVTDPTNPVMLAAVEGAYLSSATDVDAIVVDGMVVVVVSSYQTDTITMLDMTDPLDHIVLSSIQGHDGNSFFHGPESIRVAAIGDGIFVAVSNGNDSMQIMNITDPLNPIRSSTTGLLYDHTSYGVTDVDVFQMGSGTYVVFQTIDENVTSFLDTTNPERLIALPPIPPLHHIGQFE